MNNKTSDMQVFEYFREIHGIEPLTKEKDEQVLPKPMLMSHFNVLAHIIRSEGNHTPANLASVMQVTRASMSNTLAKLEKMEFINVISDPNDGRGKIIQLTQEGINAYQLAITKIAPVFKELIDSLGLDVFEKTLPELKKVSSYLDNNR